MNKNYHKTVHTTYGEVVIDIDSGSGFCFGVINAIRKAEKEIQESGSLLSLGNMVHNDEEVARLQSIGLTSISQNEFAKAENKKVLFRAHGEPPESYALAKEKQISIIDATCPVVLRLQKMIKRAWIENKENDAQIIIFGKKGHAEVVGLAGQTNNDCIIIEKIEEIDIIDKNKPTFVFSQTTKAIDEYNLLCNRIKKTVNNSVKIYQTICKQVSGRTPKLEEFVAKYEVVFFVGGAKSSNANYLFNFCKKHNAQTYFISSEEDLQKKNYEGKNSIGICGATSTPMWLMEKVSESIEKNIKIS